MPSFLASLLDGKIMPTFGAAAASPQQGAPAAAPHHESAFPALPAAAASSARPVINILLGAPPA